MDLFTTLVKLAHEEIPQDRFIDGNLQNNIGILNSPGSHLLATANSLY